MTIVFVSDYRDSYTGFKADVTFIDPGNFNVFLLYLLRLRKYLKALLFRYFWLENDALDFLAQRFTYKNKIIPVIM